MLKGKEFIILKKMIRICVLPLWGGHWNIRCDEILVHFNSCPSRANGVHRSSFSWSQSWPFKFNKNKAPSHFLFPDHHESSSQSLRTVTEEEC